MMISVLIDYEKISPVVLVSIIESSIQGSICWYEDVDEDFFEFTINCKNENLSDVEKLLSSFV